MAFRILLTLLCLAGLHTGLAEERPLLETKYGKLRGVTLFVKETSRTSDAFFGVPFAKPPVSSLRFKNPEVPESWKSIREASQYPPICPQHPQYNLRDVKNFRSSFEVPPASEDCLYLNVFTPSDREERPYLPVMVFIHGGGLLLGGASLYDGSALSVYGNVVVVVIQYRLGILGYFSTGDGQLPGNLGFMDQVAALRWVKGNIAAFGGDPQSVTIFGESAGGISANAHILSPLSAGLFHRAIAESGTMELPGFVVSTPEELIPYRNIISELAGCEPSSVVACLTGKSEEEMKEIINNMGLLFLPVCVDGIFLPKPAAEILASKQINGVPLLLGFNNHDFGWLVAQTFGIGRMQDGMSRESAQRIIQNIPLMMFEMLRRNRAIFWATLFLCCEFQAVAETEPGPASGVMIQEIPGFILTEKRVLSQKVYLSLDPSIAIGRRFNLTELQSPFFSGWYRMHLAYSRESATDLGAYEGNLCQR